MFSNSECFTHVILSNLLKGKKIIKENNSFYSDISYLSTIKKNPSNIEIFNESLNRLVNHMVTKSEVTEHTDTIDISPSILTKIMVNKFNEKYSEITESEKKIIKSILNGKNEDKVNTVNNLKRECIDSIDKKLNENIDLDLKDKLLKVKDKLLTTEYKKDDYHNDVIKLYNLKETIDNE